MVQQDLSSDYSFIFCGEGELPVLFEMRDNVLLKNKEAGQPQLLIIDIKNEDYYHFLKSPDFILGVKYLEQMIAFTIITFNQESLSMFKEEIPLLQQAGDHVAYVELSLVHENFRGKGLQKIMLKEVERILRKRNTKQITAIVSPENIPSRQSLLKSEFQIIGTFVYHGYDRLKVSKIIENV
ncbi:MAG: GNAT family N-acetyltransferase [Planctomycetia bacterium]|nr:GNAT family N-acetyltransferase [Planctomycetia bacterium]